MAVRADHRSEPLYYSTTYLQSNFAYPVLLSKILGRTYGTFL